MASTIYGEARTGKAGVTSSDGKTIKVRESYTFRVVTDSKNTTRQEVLFGTPGIPLAGLVYDQNNLMCTSVNATRSTEHPLYWEVECEFESVHEGQKKNPANPTSPDPTTWIPVFKVDSFTTRDVALWRDKDGVAIKNSAGQPFFPPLMTKVTLASFSLLQFEDASLTLLQIMGRNNKVNSTAFAGYGERTLLLELQSAELGYFGGFEAWKIGYRCTYDPNTWDEKVLDSGSKMLNGSGDLVDYVDDHEMPGMVGLLDGAGLPTSTPTDLTFKIKEELDFSTFIRQ